MPNTNNAIPKTNPLSAGKCLHGVSMADHCQSCIGKVAAPNAGAPLAEELDEFLEAQDALDNHGRNGINAEPWEVLMRRRNAARRDLDAAMAAPPQPVTQEQHDAATAQIRQAFEEDEDAEASLADGEVVSAHHDHSTVWSTEPTGEPDNAWSWPVAGAKVYLAAPAQQAGAPASSAPMEPMQKWTDADGTKWEGVRGGPWKRTPASRPQCRDCADFGPICPNSGKRCDGAATDAAEPAEAAQQAGAPLPLAPAGVADLRKAMWLDPECAHAGACQSLKFKALPLAPSDALRDVLAEREKQRANYGDPHDDEHGHRILSDEAAGYLLSGQAPMRSSWCYNSKVRDRDPRRVQLVKGVALGLAAIECLDRGPRYRATHAPSAAKKEGHP